MTVWSEACGPTVLPTTRHDSFTSLCCSLALRMCLPQADFDIPKRCTYKDTEVYDQAVTEYEKISASQGRGKESSKGGHSGKGGKGKGNDKSGGKAKVHAASCQAVSFNNVAVSCHDVCLCRERAIKIMGSASMTTTRVRPLRGKQPSYPLSWPS